MIYVFSWGMGEDKMGKFHLAVESSCPAGLEKA